LSCLRSVFVISSRRWSWLRWLYLIVIASVAWPRIFESAWIEPPLDVASEPPARAVHGSDRMPTL